MSNTYPLQARIHELLKEGNEKKKWKIEVESDYFINSNGEIWHTAEISLADFTFKIDTVAIQASQLRQILVGLKEVLGENPETARKQNERLFYRSNQKIIWLDTFYIRYRECLVSQSEALCQKWLDGLNPLFDTDPISVLTELGEILENLLK